MDADRVAQRALELHDKASMPLAEALALAIREAAPAPIWPIAGLLVESGKVVLGSHLYAPGLPDGWHDVYPLPADADAAPIAGVNVGVKPCCGFPVGGPCPDCPDASLFPQSSRKDEGS